MDVLTVVQEDRVVAVVRADAIADPRGLATTLADAGIRCVEFTFTTPDVLGAISAARNGDAVVGAGSVLDADQARGAVEAGARFVVSPACVPELGPVCRELSVPLFLGAYTPTEIVAARRAGATAIKLFPAAVGGAAYLKQLLGRSRTSRSCRREVSTSSRRARFSTPARLPSTQARACRRPTSSRAGTTKRSRAALTLSSPRSADRR
jgi:Entner-Doudoroff aldolase